MLKTFRTVSIILTVSWMVVIFLFSCENAFESAKTSGSTIRFFLNIFYPDFKALAESVQAEIIESFQYIVRKIAHFTIYMILGVLTFLSVVTYKNIALKFRLGINLSVCLLYAVSDEIHQLFVPGRVGHINDVFIDFSGAVIGTAILLLVVKFSKSRFIKNNT